VLEGLRGEIPASHLCRRESFSPALFYQWSIAFLEAGKNGLTVDTKRDATRGEVQRLREENEALKKALAESVLDVQRLQKKSLHLRRRYPRMTPEQKLGILRSVEPSCLPAKEALIRLDVPFLTYYPWKANFERQGIDGLRDRSPFKGKTWNQVLPHEESGRRWLE